MDQGIFVKSTTGLKVLTETSYADEATLQQLLEEHPELIAGVATGDDSRRLLLVKREASVSSDDPGRGYSLDHLYVDSRGVPVFVEVKLSTDTRIRREVVGQLLDYVALGIPDWPVEKIKQAVEITHPGEDMSDLLSSKLKWEGEADEFWERVDANLRATKVRMVFVANRLPPDLKRVIEFLNEQMRDVDVLGVEVPVYGDEPLRAFVPRVVGDTADARQAKDKASRPYWNKDTFVQEALNRGASESEAEAMRILFAHVEKYGDPHYGSGATPGINGWYRLAEQSKSTRPLWYVSTGAGPNKSYLNFYPLEIQKLDEARLAPFAEALKAIPGFATVATEWEKDQWDRFPKLMLGSLLENDPGLAKTLDAIDRGRYSSGPTP